MLCVHGVEDTTVVPEQSERYAAVDPSVEVAAVPGDHMPLIDVDGAAWDLARTWLDRHRTPGPELSTLVP